ncbi:hypothetical protein GQ43DRAFT_306391 [Delitschia confertaspora ATCC 74209]|uniref:Uncharacterized protein n=1 Tax=Delitschia confertaspora ATCC 74209 TaxID=1513339 RepID=A0A9P4JSQ0_9PLEO|nr:hypothetical protein GQ43DRAFT_306391 [Delitschia confertaspora ATCC 74209]
MAHSRWVDCEWRGCGRSWKAGQGKLYGKSFIYIYASLPGGWGRTASFLSSLLSVSAFYVCCDIPPCLFFLFTPLVSVC